MSLPNAWSFLRSKSRGMPPSAGHSLGSRIIDSKHSALHALGTQSQRSHETVICAMAHSPSEQRVLPRGEQRLFISAVLREAKLLQLKLLAASICEGGGVRGRSS
jgi:hypothetical protein